ncbi:hypothetical protein FGG08_004483 [Glutinoglossum americanum]|uniref:Uncharacterized protein n=1 Tax=Glutinoglossum americanum TaxID=1670608 RepID=A0A9P8HWE3_9PEZI|nr:hypothetical protein FGG08_004483 [Glutinoglossum americanum]
MSTQLWNIDPKGDAITAAALVKGDRRLMQYFPNCGLNPDPTLESIGLPHDMDAVSAEESYKPFMEKMSQIDSKEMQRLASDIHCQAGTICWTTEEYQQSEHGKANARIGLYEIHAHQNSNQKAGWWPDIPQTSALRPLAGLKVVDLTRIIAGPTITRGLAELGASVMRVTAPHLSDYSSLHVDFNWGKWNSYLDFREKGDCERMRALILEADVVVTGYRPWVLDKFGFGQEGILELCKGRDRGIVYVRENCYGWGGPWAYRSGWQQISDACCGVSMEFGRAMGNDEPVTPVFPNSDFCTGVAGIVGTIGALLRRAKDGGSYTVDASPCNRLNTGNSANL